MQKAPILNHEKNSRLMVVPVGVSSSSVASIKSGTAQNYQPYRCLLSSVCAALLSALFLGCQALTADGGNERYIRQRQYSPEQDAENARQSRKWVDDLQAIARSCTDVQLECSDFRQTMEIPLSSAEKEELLSLILKLKPVKDDVCADIDLAFIIHMLFTMPDGTVQCIPYPHVCTPRNVSADGYAFMCWCVLPDAEAAHWHALAKYDWAIEQMKKGRKRRE